MTTEKKTPLYPHGTVDDETMDAVLSVVRSVDAEQAEHDKLPPKFTRQTGMIWPETDLSPEPYEHKK